MKKKIFLGGAYSSSKESRTVIATYAKQIEDIIKDLGFEPSLNLLSNPDVHQNKPEAETVQFKNGEWFLEAGEKAIASIKEKKIEEIKRLRTFKEEKEFIVCSMAANIALSELSKSIAAIFELSQTSQGSFMEIGLAVFSHNIPVLALSHEKHGRYFGTMLTGLPTNLLRTVKYNDDNLDGIVRKFLTEEMPEKKYSVSSIRLQTTLKNRLKVLAEQKGYKNISEFQRYIIESYLEDQ